MALNIRKRDTVSIALLIILVPIVFHTWYFRLNSPDYSISSQGGSALILTNILPRPYYLQTDPEWKDEIIGQSGSHMSDAGCTVCCVSMAFSQMGSKIDPKALNSYLTTQNGYTRAGLLKWDIAAGVTNNALFFDLPSKPTFVAIDSALQDKNPIVAKVLLWDSCIHWVLIVGKDGYDYLVKDPLCEQQSIQRLSSISKTIQSIRIVKRREAGGGVKG